MLRDIARQPIGLFPIVSRDVERNVIRVSCINPLSVNTPLVHWKWQRVFILISYESNGGVMWHRLNDLAIMRQTEIFRQAKMPTQVMTVWCALQVFKVQGNLVTFKNVKIENVYVWHYIYFKKVFNVRYHHIIPVSIVRYGYVRVDLVGSWESPCLRLI
jgi:hypothetical protein